MIKYYIMRSKQDSIELPIEKWFDSLIIASMNEEGYFADHTKADLEAFILETLTKIATRGHHNWVVDNIEYYIKTNKRPFTIMDDFVHHLMMWVELNDFLTGAEVE